VGSVAGMSGSFPDLQLPLLETLTISNMRITGTLPSSLFAKSNLHSLSIHRNQLIGNCFFVVVSFPPYI
jgi:Leucine-rich repeat (LRR) protein